jgi:mono/diheme cytochrome c family protein
VPQDKMHAFLTRGQERYNIYCVPCHSRAGDGNGMIVQRGFRRPPSFHQDRLRNAPLGHFFDVISNGFGAMPDYASQIKPEDRWAIAAYIRALQLSQNANAADVADADRDKLNTPAPVIKTPSNSRNDFETITRQPQEGGAKK